MSTIEPMQREREELEQLKRIRAENGFSISKLIELKKKGYKIVNFEEVCYV